MSCIRVTMPRRDLAGLILASALITLDGTATTVALPAIGKALSIPISRLQWISNAPLLMLAALLLPAGALGDRFGRGRIVRIGIMVFAVASVACAAAPTGLFLIGAKFVQGAGGALVLPAALAALRAAYRDAAERTRVFGIWAAWTGVAAAVGPLAGGGFVDLFSWRAVFVMSGFAAVAAVVLVPRGEPAHSSVQGGRLPLLPTAALVVLLGVAAFALIEGPTGQWSAGTFGLAAVPAAAALFVLARASNISRLLPRELTRAHNCLPANAATFGLYFGLFGLSFLLAVYTQQALGFSGTWAAGALLPVSLMLFLAEPFGRLGTWAGTRALIAAGAGIAASGILWLALAPHPLPFWSHIIAGTALFGLGISVAVSPLTQAAVSAVPEACAGAASGLNHATVRAAGLLAIALLGSIAAPGTTESISAEGFRRAMLICAAIVAVVGVGSALLVRNDAPGGLGESANSERGQETADFGSDRECA